MGHIKRNVKFPLIFPVYCWSYNHSQTATLAATNKDLLFVCCSPPLSFPYFFLLSPSPLLAFLFRQIESDHNSPPLSLCQEEGKEGQLPTGKQNQSKMSCYFRNTLLSFWTYNWQK